MPKSTAILGMILCAIAGALAENAAHKIPEQPVGAQHAAPVSDTKATLDQCQADLTDTMQQMQRVSNERDKAENDLAQKKKFFDAIITLNRDYFTVLYEPMATDITQGLPREFRAFADVQITGSLMGQPAQPARPRWVLPGKIPPQFIGRSEQLAYRYFNKSSRVFEGPTYAPTALR